MVDQAAAAKRAAPDTKVWIYRNLAQAYAEFGELELSFPFQLLLSAALLSN